MAKTEIIHVAVEPAMKAKLKQRSKSEGLSPSALIRIAIRRFLEGEPKEQTT
jgi:hypothetical protein